MSVPGSKALGVLSGHSGRRTIGTTEHNRHRDLQHTHGIDDQAQLEDMLSTRGNGTSKIKPRLPIKNKLFTDGHSVDP